MTTQAITKTGGPLLQIISHHDENIQAFHLVAGASSSDPDAAQLARHPDRAAGDRCRARADRVQHRAADPGRGRRPREGAPPHAAPPAT